MTNERLSELMLQYLAEVKKAGGTKIVVSFEGPSPVAITRMTVAEIEGVQIVVEVPETRSIVV